MPGMLPALHERFQRHTLRILAKHGMRPVAFWTTVIGASSQDLYWLLEWRSLAEREERWAALETDAEWSAIKAETEAAGVLIEYQRNMILAPTAYSPLHQLVA